MRIFVDVIHTDGALSDFDHLDALSDVDFYPNGGPAQSNTFHKIENIYRSLSDQYRQCIFRIELEVGQ